MVLVAVTALREMHDARSAPNAGWEALAFKTVWWERPTMKRFTHD